MKRLLLFVVAISAILLLLSACGGSSSETADAGNDDEHVEDEHMEGEDEHMEGDHEHEEGEDEHMEGDMGHMHVDPPEEFADLTNPFAGDADALAAGQAIFETNCVTCHGTEGHGDGPGATGLDPKPADLGDHEMMEMMSDGYLFWRVSKGGAGDPFNSAMPVWENTLSEDQRWQVITYVRSFTED